MGINLGTAKAGVNSGGLTAGINVGQLSAADNTAGLIGTGLNIGQVGAGRSRRRLLLLQQGATPPLLRRLLDVVATSNAVAVNKGLNLGTIEAVSQSQAAGTGRENVNAASNAAALNDVGDVNLGNLLSQSAVQAIGTG